MLTIVVVESAPINTNLYLACELQLEAAKTELRTKAGLDGRQARVARTQGDAVAASPLAVAQARRDETERVRNAADTHASVSHGNLSDAARCAIGIR